MHDPFCRPREALRQLLQHSGAGQPACSITIHDELPCNQRVCQGAVYRIYAREHMLQASKA
jgi:hypothetical protein